MPVGPVDRDGVTADEVDLQRVHVLRDARSNHADLTSHFIHAAGAGTGEPQLAGRVHADVAALPGDLDIVLVGPADLDWRVNMRLTHHRFLRRANARGARNPRRFHRRPGFTLSKKATMAESQSNF